MDQLDIRRTREVPTCGCRAVEIFVFGSNKKGVHGAGAAKHAVAEYGAKHGKGAGPTGFAYAIPTKGREMEILPLDEIAGHVHDFINYATRHPEKVFIVTRVGCGLSRYKDSDMAPLFQGSPDNCRFDVRWKDWLGEGYEYFHF